MLAFRRGFHEAKVRRVLALLHHHRDFGDGSRKPYLFGRLIRVAEDYDNLARLDAGGLGPAEALEALCSSSGELYDPLLVQLLVNTVGRYPPGTFLELEDGRIVQTLSLVRAKDTFARPRARLVRAADGKEPKTPTTLDLANESAVKRALRRLPSQDGAHAGKPRER